MTRHLREDGNVTEVCFLLDFVTDEDHNRLPGQEPVLVAELCKVQPSCGENKSRVPNGSCGRSPLTWVAEVRD